MVFSTAGFPPVFPQKRLELKSLKGSTKVEELRQQSPQLLSLRTPLKALYFERFLRKNWWKTVEPRVHSGGKDPLLKNLQLRKLRKASGLDLQVISGIRTCFCISCFWTTIISSIYNNHPLDLKLVSNDAPCDLLQSALKIRL
jgi:hypothetical protein